MSLTTEQTALLFRELADLKAELNAMHASVEHFNREVLDMQRSGSSDSTATPLTPERFVFRVRAAIEELTEAIKAYKNGDHAEVVDAFLDNVVFSLGAVYEMNVPAGHCFSEICDKNLEKKKGALAKRPESGGVDASKPEGWTPPNHEWCFHLSPVAVEVARLHASKDQDYGDWRQYFPFGHSSFQQMMHMKMVRARNLNPDINTRSPNHESLRDTIMDMVNYCNFYIQWMDENE